MIDYNTKLLYVMKNYGPLNMRFRFYMKDPVNPDALYNALQKTLIRYPYLAKRIALKNGCYVLEENPLPVPVIKSRTPMPAFGSEEFNGHLICADYEGNEINLTMLHNLGGGRGLFRWCFSVLYQYIWELTGEDPKLEGVRRPDLPPESGEELMQPLEHLPDIEPVWKGFPPEVKPIPQSELEELLREEKPEGVYVTTFALDEEKVMEKVKEDGASPAVWFGVIYYKALLRCIPEAPDYLDLGVSCDVSDQFGFSESMSLITKFLHFVIAKEESEQEVAALCQKGRKTLKEQRDPGATVALLKKERDTLIRMEELPTITEKARYYMHNSVIGEMVPSALVSYVGKYEIPGIEKYIDYHIAAGFNTTTGILITAENGMFIPHIAHKYVDAKIVRAFEEELKERGLEVIFSERNVNQNTPGLVLPEEE